MRFGLNEKVIFQINSVFEKHPEVEEVWLYGSRAKGNFREGSDIDLTLKGIRLNDQIEKQIYRELDELNTPYLFDVSIYENLITPDLIDHINRIGKIFYSKISADTENS